MKRTIIAVISMVLILFAFSACRPTNIVGIPIDPTPDTPVTPPSDPSIPEYTIQVGDKTYRFLDDAISEAAVGSTIEIGAGEYRVASAIPVSKNLTIVGAGIDKTTITVSGGGAFTVTGDSFKISNLTISDESSDLTAFRSVINIGSTKATVDSVKITGGYSSTTENFKIVGIITNQNTESVTITNSRFEGFRVPIETDNDLANDAFTALIRGNTFEDFDKVTFEYREEGVTIEDNKFVLESDTDKSFQISLDWEKGTITPEQAIAVAADNDCVVQILRAKQNYDAEGFIISDLENLNSFASGKAGSVAKLAAPITVTAPITFSANNLVLVGNEEAVISATMGSGKHQSEVFVLNGTGITLDSIHFEAGDTNTNRIDFVIANGANATVEKCVFTGSDAAKEGTWIIYGVTSYADNTEVIGNTFEKLRVPFYFYENRSSNGKAIGNIVTDCFKIDLESDDLVDNIYDNTISNTPVTILTTVNGVMPADKVATLAKNNKTDVTHNGVTYNAEGKAEIASANDLASVFAASETTEKLLEAVITESFTVEKPVSGGGN